MKPAMSFPVISFLLVFAAILAPNAVCSRHNVVLDTAGRPVESGVSYYIVPAQGQTGGGLVPSSRTFNLSKICPLDVVQSPLPFVPGIPVTLSPEEGKSGSILLSSNLNIEFDSGVWFCPESKVWKVDGEDTQFNQRFVTTDGAKGKADSRFRIAKHGDAYVLKGSTGSSSDELKRIGTFADSLGVRRLVLGGGEFKVKFKRAYDANRFEKTMLRMFPFY